MMLMSYIVAGELSAQPALVLSVGMASPASAPSLWRDFRVLLGEFMSFCAMRFRLFFRSACHSAKCEACCEDAPARVKNFRKWQALSRPLDDCVSFEAAQVGQINGLVGYSINHDKPRDSLIALLLSFCRPPAIVRLVILVIIFSVKSEASRLFSHIRNKVFECLPSFANRDSSSSIVAPLAHRRVFATVEHSLPCVVERVPAFRLFRSHALSIAQMA